MTVANDAAVQPFVPFVKSSSLVDGMTVANDAAMQPFVQSRA